jgi:predicted MFS family arabinose efflux permease
MEGNTNARIITLPAGVTNGLWLMFAICLLGNVMGGATSTMMSVYLPVISKEILGNMDVVRFNKISALINAVYLAGWTLGGFTWGYIGDRLGRSRSISTSIVMFGFFSFLASFAHSWEALVFYRFLTGFGVGGMMVLYTILLSEAWPERTRAIAIGIVSVGFPVGIMSSGMVNYFVPGWRPAFMLAMIPLAMGMISFKVLRESEQWKTAKYNPGKKDPDLKVNRLTLLNGSVIFGSMLIGLWATFSWIPSWVQSLLNGSDGAHERGISMMMMGLGGLTGGFFSGWIANALGIRKAMILCYSACLVIAVVLFRTATAFTVFTMAGIALLAVVFGISQGLLSVYIPLLFPVPVRSTATGFCFNIGRVITTAAVFFIGALVTLLGGYGNSLFVFSFVFLAGILFLLFSK